MRYERNEQSPELYTHTYDHPVSKPIQHHVPRTTFVNYTQFSSKMTAYTVVKERFRLSFEFSIMYPSGPP